VYLLYVDESGAHGGSHSFVLGGIAVHAQDAFLVGRRLDRLVADAIVGHGGAAADHELHGSELRNAKPASRTARPASPWAAIPRERRLGVLVAAYRQIIEFEPTDARFPVTLFGVVVERNFRSSSPLIQRERFAYDPT